MPWEPPVKELVEVLHTRMDDVEDVVQPILFIFTHTYYLMGFWGFGVLG